MPIMDDSIATGRPKQVNVAVALLLVSTAIGVAVWVYAVSSLGSPLEFLTHRRYGPPLLLGVAANAVLAVALLRRWRFSRVATLVLWLPWPPDLFPSVDRAISEMGYPAGLWLDWFCLVVLLALAFLLFSRAASAWFVVRPARAHSSDA